MAPVGWAICWRTVAHSTVGGCTDGKFTLGLLLPLALLEGNDELGIPPQPWAPVDSMLDSLVSCPVASEPCFDEIPLAKVYSVGSEILPFGLFPSDKLGAHVRVRSVFNSTRWGSRKLTLVEIANLWDVPILLQEHCATSRSSIVLSELLTSTPGKVLQLGTDALLASYFFGGV